MRNFRGDYTKDSPINSMGSARATGGQTQVTRKASGGLQYKNEEWRWKREARRSRIPPSAGVLIFFRESRNMARRSCATPPWQAFRLRRQPCLLLNNNTSPRSCGIQARLSPSPASPAIPPLSRCYRKMSRLLSATPAGHVNPRIPILRFVSDLLVQVRLTPLRSSLRRSSAVPKVFPFQL